MGRHAWCPILAERDLQEISRAGKDFRRSDVTVARRCFGQVAQEFQELAR